MTLTSIFKVMTLTFIPENPTICKVLALHLAPKNKWWEESHFISSGYTSLRASTGETACSIQFFSSSWIYRLSMRSFSDKSAFQEASLNLISVQVGYALTITCTSRTGNFHCRKWLILCYLFAFSVKYRTSFCVVSGCQDFEQKPTGFSYWFSLWRQMNKKYASYFLHFCLFFVAVFYNFFYVTTLLLTPPS